MCHPERSEGSKTILSEVCEFIVDCPHSTANDEGVGFPLVRTPNVGKGRLVYNDMHRVSEDVYNQRNFRAVPQEDDLIFAREAPAGNVALIRKGEKVCLGQRTVLLRPNKQKVDPSFLTYYLLAPKQQYGLTGTANGATVAHVNMPTIRNLAIELPDIKVQRKLGGILSAYDNLIENNQKQIKLLEEAAQRLYKQWFIDLRFPGHETAEFENGLPASWRKARIADLVSFLNGFAFKSEDYDDAGRYIVVTIKNVQDGYFDMSSVERIGFLPSRMPQYCILKKGDIIMSLTGNVGRVCIVSSDGCLLNQRVCKIESKYPLFAYSFFRQEAVFQMLCNIAYGTAQLNLSPILAGKTRTILPPDELIAQFENKVAELYEAIQNYREQNETLVKQRDLLLPRLMSGKLEV